MQHVRQVKTFSKSYSMKTKRFYLRLVFLGGPVFNLSNIPEIEASEINNRFACVGSILNIHLITLACHLLNVYFPL